MDTAKCLVLFKRRGLIRDFEAALDNGRAQFAIEVGLGHRQHRVEQSRHVGNLPNQQGGVEGTESAAGDMGDELRQHERQGHLRQRDDDEDLSEKEDRDPTWLH